MTWTPARRKAFIVAALRAGTRRWPPKFNTLNAAKTTKKVNSKTGRVAQHYICAACTNEFTSKDINVDHIAPVVSPLEGFTTWDSYIDGLFCGEDNLQVLCIPCHQKKTKEESNEVRSSSAGRTRKSKVHSSDE
jgi:hypothetical protein